MIAPFFTSMTFTIAVMTISCKWDWNKLVGPVYCLPGFQLVKHFQLLKELKNAMTEMDLVDDFTKSVSSWIERIL